MYIRLSQVLPRFLSRAPVSPVTCALIVHRAFSFFQRDLSIPHYEAVNRLRYCSVVDFCLFLFLFFSYENCDREDTFERMSPVSDSGRIRIRFVWKKISKGEIKVNLTTQSSDFELM